MQISLPVSVDLIYLDSHGWNNDWHFWISGTYWIRLKGVGACASRQIQQFAILTYSENYIGDIFLQEPNKVFPSYNFDFGLTSVSHIRTSSHMFEIPSFSSFLCAVAESSKYNMRSTHNRKEKTFLHNWFIIIHRKSWSQWSAVWLSIYAWLWKSQGRFWGGL